MDMRCLPKFSRLKRGECTFTKLSDLPVPTLPHGLFALNSTGPPIMLFWRIELELQRHELVRKISVNQILKAGGKERDWDSEDKAMTLREEETTP